MWILENSRFSRISRFPELGGHPVQSFVTLNQLILFYYQLYRSVFRSFLFSFSSVILFAIHLAKTSRSRERKKERKRETVGNLLPRKRERSKKQKKRHSTEEREREFLSIHGERENSSIEIIHSSRPNCFCLLICCTESEEKATCLH